MHLLSTFDKRLSIAIKDLPESYRRVMSGLSLIGEPLVVITAGFVGYMVALKRGQLGVEHAFVYGVIAFSCNTLLKLLLHRKRPHDLVIETLGVRSYSFPSGHAFGTVIFYGPSLGRNNL
jgi:membrane-associated phospholipid phosphatase